MPKKIETKTFEVRRDSWGDTRIVEQALDSDLGKGQVLFKVDRLALTSNNISYASSGDQLGYWRFFPTTEGWGRIPAMGWADVVASNHGQVNPGERVWGFFPMSNYHKIPVGEVTARSLSDVSPHRAEHAAVYVQFDRASTSTIYEESREDQDSLLRGLFLTSWLVEDFVNSHDSFGAHDYLITSASSKTSIALANCIKRRGLLTSVGITSRGNVKFCQGLGCYDRVITYQDVAALDADRSVVLVDMAGNAGVIGELHNHFGDNMKHSCRIGATHYTEMGSVKGLPGPKPQFFFAPTQAKARIAQLGAAEFMKRVWAAYVNFRRYCDDWLNIEQSVGPEAVTRAYQALLAGQIDPAHGQIISLGS